MSASAASSSATPTSPAIEEASPAAIVALVAAAMVSSINLGAANIALVRIGTALQATQADLTHVGAAAILGMAGGVLYLGRLSQRWGRTRVIRIGIALSIPLSLAAAFAPSVGWLIAARVAIGVVGAMIYPNTLATIVATTADHRRQRGIGLWFGFSVGAAALGPVIAGVLMHWFWWGTAFLVSVPVCVVAITLSGSLPARAGEDRHDVDHVAGWLSVGGIAILVAALSLGGTPVPLPVAALAGAAAILAAIAFLHRQRTRPHPMFDLRVAARPAFWIAAIAGSTLVGSMLAAFFLGQQFMQHVLHYSTTAAGLAVLPTGVAIVFLSPRAAGWGATLGGRTMLLAGSAITAIGLGLMLVWTEGGSYLPIGGAYLALGAGVGLVGPTVSRTLMATVPRSQLAMGSATSDLQSCLGGAVLIAILGSVLAVGYHHAFDASVASLPGLDAEDASSLARRSPAAAERLVSTMSPEVRDRVDDLLRSSFIEGFRWALLGGLAALALVAVVVGVLFPGRLRQRELEAAYAAES